jgi:hypothetical protein
MSPAACISRWICSTAACTAVPMTACTDPDVLVGSVPAEPVAGAAAASADLAHADLRCCERGRALVPLEQQLGRRGGHRLVAEQDDAGRRPSASSSVGAPSRRPSRRGPRRSARFRRRVLGLQLLDLGGIASSSTTSASWTSPVVVSTRWPATSASVGFGCLLVEHGLGQLEAERDLGAATVAQCETARQPSIRFGYFDQTSFRSASPALGLLDRERLGVRLAGVAAGDGAGRLLLVGDEFDAVAGLADLRQPQLPGHRRPAVDDVDRWIACIGREADLLAVQDGDEHVGRLVAQRVAAGARTARAPATCARPGRGSSSANATDVRAGGACGFVLVWS